jgi:hypothetical protein
MVFGNKKRILNKNFVFKFKKKVRVNRGSIKELNPTTGEKKNSREKHNCDIADEFIVIELPP